MIYIRAKLNVTCLRVGTGRICTDNVVEIDYSTPNFAFIDYIKSKILSKTIFVLKMSGMQCADQTRE